MRTWLLGLIPALLVGCKTPPPGIDPFLRTRIPPPASGEAAPLYDGPAYDPPQQGAPMQPSGPGTYQPPAAADPGASNVPSQTPYGRQNFPTRFRTSAARDPSTTPQDPLDALQPPEVELASAEVEQPGAVQLAGGSGSSTARSRIVPADYQSEIRILTPEDPQEMAPADSDLANAAAQQRVPGEPWPSSKPRASAPQTAARGIHPPSAHGTSVRTRAAASARDQPYGYDPDYTWLRGKLEYSQRDRRWKLRYIPVDGSTDRYGGSVVLTNPQQLDGFEPGEFVEIEGTLAGSVGREPFAPGYRVERVVAQGL